MKTPDIQNKKTIENSELDQGNDTSRDVIHRISAMADNRPQTSTLTQMKGLLEDNPRVTAQRKEFAGSMKLKVGGGYDGKNIYLSNANNSIDALTHELGHAALKHTPSSTGKGIDMGGGKYHVDRVKEKEANDAGTKIKDAMGTEGTSAIMEAFNKTSRASSDSPHTMLPFLVDGWGAPLPDASINRLLTLAEYRHNAEEAHLLGDQIKHEQSQLGRVDLNTFVGILKGAHHKATKRAGHLLSLILHEFQDWTGTERSGPTSQMAWEGFEGAIRFIRYLTSRWPKINAPGNDEETVSLLHPEPSAFNFSSSDLGVISGIHQDQWQAAAVAAMRAGWLTGIGFLELKRAFKTATLGLPNLVELQLSRDVIHESGLRTESGDVRMGTVQIPQYAVTEKTLNAAMSYFASSGYYYERFGIILKSLDVGHKLVDKWENYSHRTKGKHVEPDVNFQFLSLLSPKQGSQEVIGANGKVLGDGSYMFTIDPSFRVRYMPAANFAGEGGTNKNFFQFIPHSQLASLGLVVAAGNFVIHQGKFSWIDNGSGHYRVDAGVNEVNAKAALKNLGYNMSLVHFLNRANGDLDTIYGQGNAILEPLPQGEDRPEMTWEIRLMQKAMDSMK